MPKTDPEAYTEAETIARREAALKRAFTMPHKPHKPVGDRKAGGVYIFPAGTYEVPGLDLMRFWAPQ